MTMNRRKELQEQYKNMKPDMGVFIVRSIFSNKCYIEETKDLRSAINRTGFILQYGGHPNKGLQNDWKKHGEENFVIEILEKLSYDKDESKTDYNDELTLLKILWEEKLERRDGVLFQKGYIENLYRRVYRHNLQQYGDRAIQTMEASFSFDYTIHYIQRGKMKQPAVLLF